MPDRRLIIAGTHSGVGKTTVALILMAALRRRGLTVQPFKVGPDFIDPGHHTSVCGRVSRNLDTWMLPEAANQAVFARARADADIAVIEGVMGLFDGRSADDGRGSTAHVARLLNAPIVLVVDAAAMAGSVAAVVKGFSEFDPEVRIVGIVCNHVAGPRHYACLESALRRHTGVEPLGWLPRQPEWTIPERHLGLLTSEDLRTTTGLFDLDQAAKAFEASIDLDKLLQLSECRRAARRKPAGGRDSPAGLRRAARQKVAGRRRLAVARDAAFCFYYQDNLDLFQAAGAEVVSFSPLHDTCLPDGVDLVYLGGGYPELHAERLAANRTMRDSLRRFHQQGGAIYAECGGLMYCCRELVNAEGRCLPMLDLLPARTVMQRRLAALGYVTWRADGDTLFGPAGTEVRGHVFHYSHLEPLAPLQSAAHLHRDGEQPNPDGFVHQRLLAGYAHLHFGSNPQAAAALLKQCRRG